MSHGLLIKPTNLTLLAYNNSDWAGDKFNHKLITRYCVLLDSVPISWVAKKQATIACFSVEAEYHALASTAAELSWIRSLLTEFHLPPNTFIVILVVPYSILLADH